MNNILIISGSPRKGNMHRLSELLTKCLIARGDNVKTFHLSSLDIQYCTGCLKCEDEGICPIIDDNESIKTEMLLADIVVFATPVYFDNIPGKMKSLIDRSNLYINKLKGKKCLVALCGQADEQSWNNCANIIKNYIKICGMDFLGNVVENARKSDDLTNAQLEQMVVKLINLLGEFNGKTAYR
jgi:multimeric flavodoxin WrbA